MITGCAISTPKKTYFRCFGNSLRINPLELFSTSCPFSSPLLDFLHRFLLERVLFLEIQDWNLDIQHHEPQSIENSSFSHSLNSEFYDHRSVED